MSTSLHFAGAGATARFWWMPKLIASLIYWKIRRLMRSLIGSPTIRVPKSSAVTGMASTPARRLTSAEPSFARHVQPGVRPACSIHFCSSGRCASSRLVTLMYRVRSVVPSGGGDSKSAPPRKTTFTETS